MARMSERPTRCLICEARLHNPVCQLPGDSLNRFAEASSTATYSSGQTIFSQGDAPGDVFIIRSGQVRLTFHHPDGAEQVLRLAGPGEIVGAGISGRRSLSMTALAKTSTTVCRSRLKDIEELVASDSKFALAWGHLLMDEISRARASVYHLGPHAAGVRLARLLHDIGRKSSRADDGMMVVRVTHSDLALSLSVAQETTTRLLADLQDRNIVKLSRGRIDILDADRLLALAGYPGSDVESERFD